MGTIYLALAFHNHQPVGNFDWVFEEAYRRAYEPMIAALERHPGVRVALHYTGPLRDWLQEHRPELLLRIRRLVARGQVEIMAGAYYEPILAVIPDEDKEGQIRRHIESVRADFGAEPTGFWLAERVWEPHLPRALAQAGIAYTIVDDTHFKWVGLSDDDLFGYYITEELGFPLKIFGTSKHLRYTIPWAPVREVIAWLREQAERPCPRAPPSRRRDGRRRGEVRALAGDRCPLLGSGMDRRVLHRPGGERRLADPHPRRANTPPASLPWAGSICPPPLTMR
jgi:hypothetical protein